MVVLDAVHRIQAEQAPRPGRALELQGRQVRLVLGGDQRQAAADVHDAAEHARPARAGHRRADAGVSARSRIWSPTCRGTSASRRRSRSSSRGQPDAPDGTWRMAQTRHRSRAGVPQVHRVLPLPGRLPRAARSRQARGVHRAALLRLRRARSRCTRSTPTTASPDLKDKHGIGYCNITKCCTKVCPEHINITDNAIIPLKERVVDRFYDPVTRLLRMVTGGWRWPKSRTGQRRKPAPRPCCPALTRRGFSSLLIARFDFVALDAVCSTWSRRPVRPPRTRALAGSETRGRCRGQRVVSRVSAGRPESKA